MIIVSPFAKPDSTDSTTASYSSILAYIEHAFGLVPLSTTDATAYDYGKSFNYAQTPLAPVRMTTRAISAATLQQLASIPVNPTDPT
jgi:hypothetical protein